MISKKPHIDSKNVVKKSINIKNVMEGFLIAISIKSVNSIVKDVYEKNIDCNNHL